MNLDVMHLCRLQVGQQNFCCDSRGRYFLLSGISNFCSSLFQWNWWLRIHSKSEQKNFRILPKSTTWSEAVFAPLQHSARMEGPFWSSMGDFSAEKICLWSIGNTSSWPAHISKSNNLLMTTLSTFYFIVNNLWKKKKKKIVLHGSAKIKML